MIEIKAKNNGEDTDISIRIEGKGTRIAKEAAIILVELPKQLIEADPKLFHAMKETFQHIAKEAKEKMEEESNDQLN